MANTSDSSLLFPPPSTRTSPRSLAESMTLSLIPLPTGEPPIVERPPLPIGDPLNDQRPLQPQDHALPVRDPLSKECCCTFSFNPLNPNLISVHTINIPATLAPNSVADPSTSVDSSLGTNMFGSEDKMSLPGSSFKRALDFEEEVSASLAGREGYYKRTLFLCHYPGVI